ncbi:MAG TPA: lytic murein transglycosylase, partial [Phenylobacterium sp.]|nr:lytic murein transglycosylase [Phenylobacterium sp.]
MDRRSFPVLPVAGCADPTSPMTPQIALAPGVGSGARPVLDVPPSGSPAFDSWLQDFYGRALSQGLSPDLL